MYVERTRPTELDVHQSYKSGQLLLETAKMHGLNEFNLKKIWSEAEKGNVPSDLPLADKRTIHFMIKKAKRLHYSIQLDDFEKAELNHFADEQVNRIQDEEIDNISSSMYRLFRARMTEKEIPENQKETPGNQKETLGNQREIPGNQKETPGNQKDTPAKTSESDFVFLRPKVYYCYYCHKVFFHPTTYRRHMIHQLKKLHWCSVCKRGFISKIWFKRHKLFCNIA